MEVRKSHLIPAATILLSLISVFVGWVAGYPLLVAGGTIVACYVLVRLVCRAYKALNQALRPQEAEPPQPAPKPAPTPAPKPVRRGSVDPTDTQGLVEQMLAQQRFALLLRPKIVSNLSENHFDRTMEALEEAMSLVPDGDVVLGRIDDALEDGKLDPREIEVARGRIIAVDRFFLDRYPVTNAQFYEFVAAGGYEQMALWDRSIWPAILDLVDATGMPGPRYWRDGCFLSGEENHPVVGVSWYEAAAYARWVGKRLPSDAEWVKAGSWPVALSSTSRVQRKYPWGDTMTSSRANLWGSGPEQIVPVDQFAEGVSVGGVYQLIGNVWEWTGGSFRATDHPAGQLILPTPMKNIRGGAYDTYFDNQATCQFNSGENPLHRRHNIGFRCAVGVCDLALSRSPTAQTRSSEQRQTKDSVTEQVPSTEEVPV